LIEKEENNLDTCIMFWGYEKAFNSILWPTHYWHIETQKHPPKITASHCVHIIRNLSNISVSAFINHGVCRACTLSPHLKEHLNKILHGRKYVKGIQMSRNKCLNRLPRLWEHYKTRELRNQRHI
jgi:hypothetical protein